MTRLRRCPACDVAWAKSEPTCWLCGAEGVETWLMIMQSCDAPDPLRVGKHEGASA